MSTSLISPYPGRLALVLAAIAAFNLSACSSDSDQDNDDTQQDGGVDAPNDTINAEASCCDASDSGADVVDSGPVSDAADASDDVNAADAADAADSADASTSPQFAMFVGSNFKDKAVLSVVVLTDSPSVAGTLSSTDQDSLVSVSSNTGFFLHRTSGTVGLLDHSQPWVETKVVDVNPNDPDSGKANPWAVVVPAGNDKAYVVRYSQNSLSVLDTAAGTVTGQIDLSEFVAPGDPDGMVEAFAGVYDSSKNLVYVGLQRINQNDWGAAPDYAGACTGVDALVVGIDPSTDQVVDLNGAAEGKALHLLSADPIVMTLDANNGRLAVLGVGCAMDSGDAGSTRAGRGVEAVDLATGKSAWLWQTSVLDRPKSMVWIGDHRALIEMSDANFASHWYDWDPTTDDLGAELQGVPKKPVWAGSFGLLGLAAATDDAGSPTKFSLVSYDVDQGTSTTLLDELPSLAGLNIYDSAVLR